MPAEVAPRGNLGPWAFYPPGQKAHAGPTTYPVGPTPLRQDLASPRETCASRVSYRRWGQRWQHSWWAGARLTISADCHVLPKTPGAHAQALHCAAALPQRQMAA
eukprot:8303500-Heterocapsa_arctica.AAC.1